MSNLIDTLVGFSRLGKQDLNITKLNMNILVHDAIEKLCKPADVKNARIEIKPLQNVFADKEMLDQVFTNLISNAIKFSSKKESLFIEIGSYKANNNIIYFVKDKGCGFDAQYYYKLFGVFQHLHEPGEYEGTGIGLFITNWIINKHHGKMWAEGKVGEGAVFYFSLPENYS